MIRTLRITRRSAVKARARAANQIQARLVTAPEGLESELCELSRERRGFGQVRLLQNSRCAPIILVLASAGKPVNKMFSTQPHKTDHPLGHHLRQRVESDEIYSRARTREQP